MKAIKLAICTAILAVSLACGGGGSGTRTERCMASGSKAACPSGSVSLSSCAPTGWGDTQFVECMIGR